MPYPHRSGKCGEIINYFAEVEDEVRKNAAEITYEKILDAAITEFGTKSYETASLNTVCSENNISKGLLYHHFKSKD